MDQPDRTVIERAREGNNVAFGQLWTHYQPRLLRYLRAKRVVDPADIASQVWIDVAGAIKRFEGDGDDLARFIFTIGHRRSVDQIRRAVRRPETLSEDLTDTAQVHGAEDEWVDRTALDRAIAIIRELPDDMAEAVMLRVAYDMAISDVAEVMSRTEGSVRVLVHRGLKKLSLLQAVTDRADRTMEPVS